MLLVLVRSAEVPRKINVSPLMGMPPKPQLPLSFQLAPPEPVPVQLRTAPWAEGAHKRNATDRVKMKTLTPCKQPPDRDKGRTNISFLIRTSLSGNGVCKR